MEKCFEYFGCKKTDCIIFGMDKNTNNCWDIEETLCNHPNPDIFKKLVISKCKLCLYYQSLNSN